MLLLLLLLVVVAPLRDDNEGGGCGIDVISRPITILGSDDRSGEDDRDEFTLRLFDTLRLLMVVVA